MKHHDDRIVLALIAVLAIMIFGLMVAEILAATTNSQWEIGPNIATLLATLGGTIAGAAAGYVTGGRHGTITPPAPPAAVVEPVAASAAEHHGVDPDEPTDEWVDDELDEEVKA